MKILKLIILSLSLSIGEEVGSCGPYDEFFTCRFPEESKHLFLGDVRLTETQWITFQVNKNILLSGPGSSRGVLALNPRWPKNEIHYEISKSDFTSTQREIIESSMRVLEEVSCFRFIRREREPDYVLIQGGSTGCWSFVGKIGGVQSLNLQPNGCLEHGIILHELMHTIGYWHMHNARGRNRFIDIQFQNIEGASTQNFEVAFQSSGPLDSSQYDFSSIMHFGSHAFSKNDLPTIVALYPEQTLGQRNNLSELDIYSINNDFCLSELTTTPISTTESTSEDTTDDGTLSTTELEVTTPESIITPTTLTSDQPSPTDQTTSSREITTLVDPPGPCPRPNCTIEIEESRFPHANKFRFWICFYGFAVEQECPDNLVWDPKNELCNYNGKASCAS